MYPPFTLEQKMRLKQAFDSGLTRTDQSALPELVALANELGVSVIRVKVKEMSAIFFFTYGCSIYCVQKLFNVLM